MAGVQNAQFAKVAQMMRNKNIVDCRNLINANEAKENGFKYMGIGK